MKKIIGILGIAVIAATMFFSANGDSHSTTNKNLASLIGMNSANAEEGDICITCGWVSTDVCVTVDYHQYIGYRMISPC
jgi:hypothetical protein